MKTRQTNCILWALLLWNPLLLLMLSKSWVATLVITALLVFVALFVSKSKCLRLKVWAFNLCAISSIALHSELLFREFNSGRNIPNLYELHGNYYFNKPYLQKEFRTNEYVSSYKTNCQGYRMDDLSNADDTIKNCDWLFIGDSFTQGAQVNYSELFTTRLFSSFPNKIIVNGGISGAGLYDELNFFRDKGKQLSPNVVFLQIGVFNDFFNIKEHSATYQDYLMEKSDLYRFLAYNVFSTDSLPLGRWTEPFFPTAEENRDFNILYKEESEQKMADKKAFERCLKEWKEEVEKIGAKLIVLLIPSKEQVSPVLLKEVMDKYNIVASQLDMTAPNQLFASTASTLGIRSIDLTTDFQSSKDFPFFSNDEHLNAIGHKLIADALSKEMRQYADGTQYISKANVHERYPMFYSQDSTLLYQGQDRNKYLLLTRTGKEDMPHTLVSSFEELVHPAYSPDMRYLVYTEGNQESCETDVILQDNVLGTSQKVNQSNKYAAIPMFNHSGTLLAMPQWSNESKQVANIYIYDLSQGRFVKHIKSDMECWRPIFSLDDKSVFFIKKEKFFTVKRYDFSSGKTIDVLSLPFDIWDIALSPSGKHLVFAGNKDGNWDLFRYTFSTKDVKQLTHTKGNEWDPAFGINDCDLWFAGTFGFNDGIFYRRIDL
ncbi:MAG: hypothetical protein KHX42_07060 [Prevotella sp.]|nr:hypothetical protein [Prevotella sp.]